MPSEQPSLPTEGPTPVAVSLTGRRDARKRWLGVGVIVAITLVSFWIALNPQLVAALGQWGYVGAFFISLIASATIVLPAPGLMIVIAMGSALDPVLLGIVAGLGSAVGELSGYVAGATGSALIPAAQRHHFDRLQNLTRRYGAPLIAFLAAIPFPLFDFAGIVAGVMRMNVLAFLVAVAAGKSVKYIVLISTGASSLQLLLRWFQ